MITEEESKEVNPDALEAVFEEDSLIEEDIFVFKDEEDDEEVDALDIAFRDDDDGDW